MKNNWIKKGLVCIILFLFAGISLLPGIVALSKEPPITETDSLNSKIIKFKVTEFKPDCTSESTIIEMSFDDAKKFKTELKNAICAEDKLQVYKNYGFIPENVTLEKLKSGMQEKALKMGLTDKKLEEISEKFPLIPFFDYHEKDLKCRVLGATLFGLRFILGLSPFTRILNYYIATMLNLDIGVIPSLDLLTTLCGLFDFIWAVDGDLPDMFLMGSGITLMLGFVGFYASTISIPFTLIPFVIFEDDFFGYAAYAEVAGFYLV